MAQVCNRDLGWVGMRLSSWEGFSWPVSLTLHSRIGFCSEFMDSGWPSSQMRTTCACLLSKALQWLSTSRIPFSWKDAQSFWLGMHFSPSALWDAVFTSGGGVDRVLLQGFARV